MMFQPADAAVPYDPAPLEAELAKRQVRTGADGTRYLSLKHGEVEVRLLKEGGRVLGHELRVSLSGKTELVREAVTEGADLAATTGLSLYDFQLARTLSRNDDAAVADQFLKTARYAGEMMGVPEAIEAGFTGNVTSGALPETGTRLTGFRLLLLAVALLGLYVFVESLIRENF